jgi:hypothetical protein
MAEAISHLKPENIFFFYVRCLTSDTCKLSNLSWSCREDRNTGSGIIEYSAPELLARGKYTK